MAELTPNSDERERLVREGAELLANLPDFELRAKVAALQVLVSVDEKNQGLVRDLLAGIEPALHDDFLYYLENGEIRPALLSELHNPHSAVCKAINRLTVRQAEEVLGLPADPSEQPGTAEIKSLADLGIRGLFIP